MNLRNILKSAICLVSFSSFSAALATATENYTSREYTYGSPYNQVFDAKTKKKKKKKAFVAEHPEYFNAKIEHGQILIPQTKSHVYCNSAIFGTGDIPVREIARNGNWKFVLVKGITGKFSFRVGEKGSFGKVKLAPDHKLGLHHPTLAGFDGVTPHEVVAAGTIGFDKNRVYFVIDSGNYKIELDETSNPAINIVRNRGLVNLYHFFYNNYVTTHFEDMNFEIDDTKSVTSRVLILGID